MGLANRGRDPGPVARSDRREGRAGGLEGWRAESSGSSWRRRWLFVICSAAQKKPTTDEARQSLERCCRQGTGTLLVSSRRTKQEGTCGSPPSALSACGRAPSRAFGTCERSTGTASVLRSSDLCCDLAVGPSQDQGVITRLLLVAAPCQLPELPPTGTCTRHTMTSKRLGLRVDVLPSAIGRRLDRAGTNQLDKRR